MKLDRKHDEALVAIRDQVHLLGHLTSACAGTDWISELKEYSALSLDHAITTIYGMACVGLKSEHEPLAKAFHSSEQLKELLNELVLCKAILNLALMHAARS